MDYQSPNPSHSLPYGYGYSSSAGVEQMTLGSPTTATHQVTPSHSGLYLPGYLMGDVGSTVSPSSSRLWSRSSPPKLTPSTLGPREGLSRNESRLSQRTSLTRTPKDKTGAPPVAALFDNVESLVSSPAAHGMYTGTPERRQPDVSTSRTPLPVSSFSAATPSGLFSSPAQLPTNQQLAGVRQVPSSPAQIDPFYTQGELITPDVDLDDTWVTVFGFPPAATSFVLQQFSQYGSIVRHVVASNGNWLHLRYSSKLQARKALSKNAKIFGSNIMIGVTQCIDKGVMSGVEQCNMSTMSGVDTPTRYPIMPLGDEGGEKRAAIRPLTAAYKAASSNHEVLQDRGTPQKSTNVVSKTLEYVFGW